MVRKASKKGQSNTISAKSDGMFSGMVVYLVETGVQTRRIQVWTQKLQQMGAEISNHISRKVTHIFALDSKTLVEQIGNQHFKKSRKVFISYQWLEDCLKAGFKLPQEQYCFELRTEDRSSSHESVAKCNDESGRSLSDDHCASRTQHFDNVEKQKQLLPVSDNVHPIESLQNDPISRADIQSSENQSHSANRANATAFKYATNQPLKNSTLTLDDHRSEQSVKKETFPSYLPPDLNKHITEPFKKLQSIYKDGLGDDWRSFSYHKVISVVEKLPFKIESVHQVKGLPGLGKSMQEHIQEILQTGRLSKLEHFERDEKIRTISLFGEIWGVGPATASKLYEKGHRSLDDLKRDNSLTQAQKIGLEFFEDLKKKIPRHEVQEMEALLQRVAEEIYPGVSVVCGGSYRRGKAACGDVDFIVTHPDGRSHQGFLLRYVKALKDINFLKEDLIFSVHSSKDSDIGVDTYFGLCTYPGREQRHRIDIKVYPREMYAFGLLAWTGNDVLNRRLRLLADEKGYRLDDTGLFPVSRDDSGKKVSMAKTIPCSTEKEIFDFLGFPWLEPHERNL